MDKLSMHTPNRANENFRKLAALFPNAVTETIDSETGETVRAIDKDILMQEITTHVVEGHEERYQFTWPDKKKAMLAANAPIAATLRPVREESVGKDGTPGGWDSQNLYIEGDNLDVLKLLQETYLGKVKMIYIDPPYNTGNDFVYEDDFAEGTGDYLARSGQFDDQGNRLEQNLDSNGRFHTNWLNMIYPRIKLAKNLLTEDGLIFLSIDDNELENLKKICNEVFGKENYVDTIIWKKRYGGGAKEKYFVTLQEYVLVYCRNIFSLDEIYVPLTADSAERYYNKRDEKYELRGGYRTHPLEAGKAMDSRPNLIYPIPAPDGSMIMPKRQWLWSKERAYEALKNNDLEIIKGKDDAWVVSTKQYLRDENGEMRPGKMFSIIEDIYTQHGTNEMISIFGNAKVFSYPKPSEMIKRLISVCNDDNALILDFFSGSASTAHAVIKQNSEDGKHRKFILVQISEETAQDSDAYHLGFKSIPEIGRERIRRVGIKIKEEAGLMASNLDIGFRALKLDSSNMQDVYYNPESMTRDLLSATVDNIKIDRSPEDLLFQVMLDLGVDLSSSIEEKTIDGKKVFVVRPEGVEKEYLVACFDQGVTSETVTAIAKMQPYYAVFRDSGMASDSVATNFDQIFRTYSPQTERKVL